MSKTSRRGFLRTTTNSALVAGALGFQAEALQPHPNILIICVDQMRFRIPSTMPDNPARPTIDSLLPNITKLRSVGSKTITNPSDPQFNPGSGVNFTRHFAAATACSPARAAWVTGLYAAQTRMYATESSQAQPSLDPGFPTWGTILSDSAGVYGFRSLGYRTCWIGKWHLSGVNQTSAGLAPYGFSYVWPGVSPNGLSNQGASGGQTGYGPSSALLKGDTQIAETFRSWFAAAGKAGPWCTTVSFINPHDIAWAPLGYWALLDPANGDVDQEALLATYPVAFPVSTTFPSGGFVNSVFDGYFSQGPLAGEIPNWEDVAALSAAGIKPLEQAAMTAARQQSRGLRNADRSIQPFTNQMYVRMLDIYLWLLAMVDQQIGAVLNQVWSNARTRANTVILFTSDHGEFGGAHGMKDKNGALYDEAIRVPLSVWFPYSLQNASQPSHYSGSRNAFCSAVDFCPLVLTLASGNEGWRMNPALAHLKNRQALVDRIFQSSSTRYVRPYVLSTTDEIKIDENTPLEGGGPLHQAAYRDTAGKYIRSSFWQPCTDTIDSGQPQFFEFYDYSQGNTAEMGNDANTSPNAAAYSQKLDDAIANEMVVPPAGLSGPYGIALTNYINYTKLVTGGPCAT